MRTRPVLYVCILAVIVTSCGGVLNFQKRRYRSGFYVHKASSKTETVLLSKNAPAFKVEKLRPAEIETITLSSTAETIKEIKTSNDRRTQINSSYKIKHHTKEQTIFHINTKQKVYRQIKLRDEGDGYKEKAKRAGTKATVYWIISLFLFLCGFIVPPIFILFFITLLLALIFNARHRKYEILARVKTNPTEEEKQLALLDEQESRLARKLALLSLLFLFLALTGAVISIVALLVIVFEAFVPIAWALTYLFSGIGAIMAFTLFLRKAKAGAEAGKKVLARHPHEKYYPTHKRAIFAKRIRILSLILKVIGFIFLAFYVVFGFLIFAT